MSSVVNFNGNIAIDIDKQHVVLHIEQVLCKHCRIQFN